MEELLLPPQEREALIANRPRFTLDKVIDKSTALSHMTTSMKTDITPKTRPTSCYPPLESYIRTSRWTVPGARFSTSPQFPRRQQALYTQTFFLEPVIFLRVGHKGTVSTLATVPVVRVPLLDPMQCVHDTTDLPEY